MSLFDLLWGNRKKKKEQKKANSTAEIKEEKIVPPEKEKEEVETSSAPVAKKETVKKKTVIKNTEEECEAVANEASIEETKSTRSGKFEIKKSKDGRFVFNLYASNHVIVATSQIYSSAQSALNGIKSVMANAEKAGIEDSTLKKVETLPYPKWEIYLDKGNQYRFRLNAPNGNCICHSQGYTAKGNCKKGIESIIKFSKDAEIEKAYLNKD